MKRQGLKTTIGQLRRIADNLESELRIMYNDLDIAFPKYAGINQILFQINIINAEGLSDTWEIEDVLNKLFIFKDNIKTLNGERCFLIIESQIKKLKKQIEEVFK